MNPVSGNHEQRSPQLIVMAGLPGTGKSAIAGSLAGHLGAIVLNKDAVRAKLFPPDAIDHSRTQDDLCMEVVFLIAEYLLHADRERTVIIDGRTFSRAYQVERLLKWTRSLPIEPAVIECVCGDSVARQRIESDQAAARHPAGNRTYGLYLELKEKAETITAEHLVIDTGTETLELSVERCLAYLRSRSTE